MVSDAWPQEIYGRIASLRSNAIEVLAGLVGVDPTHDPGRVSERLVDSLQSVSNQLGSMQSLLLAHKTDPRAAPEHAGASLETEE
jgi:hypothetical protein